MDDRLVHVTLGFTADNAEIVVLDYGVTIGDPTSDEPWVELAARLARPVGPGLPVSIVGVDAGFHTSEVRKQCGRRRWWIPVVGRGGEGKAIARSIGQSGIATVGKDDSCSLWSARVAAGRVYLPADVTRHEVAELCAAQALTVERGRLRWMTIEGRQDHLWDCATYALWARHFRRLSGRRRPLRLVAV